MIEKFIEHALDKGMTKQAAKFWARTYVRESLGFVQGLDLRFMDDLVEEIYNG